MFPLYRDFVAFRRSGGTCASGGPFVVGVHCSSAEIHHILILGILGCGAAWAGFTAALRAPPLPAALLIWVMMFGSLGSGFLHGCEGLVPGATFELLAAGGLAPVLGGALTWVRRGGRPEPPAPSRHNPTSAMMGRG